MLSFDSPPLSQWATLGLMLPVLVLIAGAIAMCVSSIRQIVLLTEMDWSGPVVSIQRKLSSLHVVQTRQIYWILLMSPIVGFCRLIVVLQWLLDFLPEPHSIFEKLNAHWLWSNVVFGIAFVVVGYLATRFFASRFRNHSWWKNIEESLAGRTVVCALADLDQWKQ